jgi:hypothetical protein
VSKFYPKILHGCIASTLWGLCLHLSSPIVVIPTLVQDEPEFYPRISSLWAEPTNRWETLFLGFYLYMYNNTFFKLSTLGFGALLLKTNFSLTNFRLTVMLSSQIPTTTMTTIGDYFAFSLCHKILFPTAKKTLISCVLIHNEFLVLMKSLYYFYWLSAPFYDSALKLSTGGCLSEVFLSMF